MIVIPMQIFKCIGKDSRKWKFHLFYIGIGVVDSAGALVKGIGNQVNIYMYICIYIFVVVVIVVVVVFSRKAFSNRGLFEFL